MGARRPARKEDEPSSSLWQRTGRDMVIVGVGVVISLSQVWVKLAGGEPAPYLVAAGLACFGIPFFIRADERHK